MRSDRINLTGFKMCARVFYVIEYIILLYRFAFGLSLVESSL